MTINRLFVSSFTGRCSQAESKAFLSERVGPRASEHKAEHCCERGPPQWLTLEPRACVSQVSGGIRLAVMVPAAQPKMILFVVVSRHRVHLLVRLCVCVCVWGRGGGGAIQ